MKAALLLFCFWYPGEAGTSAQAQPLLDQFAALLSTHTPGISWRTTYLPTESEGLAFIRAKSPSFGIVSYPVYYKYRASLSMTRLASTRLLPDGRAEERLSPAPCLWSSSDRRPMGLPGRRFPLGRRQTC
ncbi:MAG: hypothetical protein HYV03_05995 [Deltaproteobacteria bacterium]|nr:hypothetical protein [Deltaproteobacteria bacterium]